MSEIVKLHVPPFEPAAPRSLSALRRQLVQPEATRCDSHCQPCASCRAAQAAEVDAARKLAADTGLRLSQLVEDALAQNLSRMEAEQAEAIHAALGAVLPHLADAVLRSALADELTKALDGLRTQTVRLAKPADLDLGDVPTGGLVVIEDDDTLSGHTVALHFDGGTTDLDADALVAACLSRLNGESPEISR